MVYLANTKQAIRIPQLRVGPHNFDILSIIYGTLLGEMLSVEVRVTVLVFLFYTFTVPHLVTLYSANTIGLLQSSPLPPFYLLPYGVEEKKSEGGEGVIQTRLASIFCAMSFVIYLHKFKWNS